MSPIIELDSHLGHFTDSGVSAGGETFRMADCYASLRGFCSGAVEHLLEAVGRLSCGSSVQRAAPGHAGDSDVPMLELVEPAAAHSKELIAAVSQWTNPSNSSR